MNGSTRRALLASIGTSGLLIAGCLGDDESDDPGNEDTVNPDDHLGPVRDDATEVEFEHVAFRALHSSHPDALEELRVISESHDFQRPTVYGTVISDEETLGSVEDAFNEEEAELAAEADLDEDSLVMLHSSSGVVMSMTFRFIGTLDSDVTYLEGYTELPGGDDPTGYRLLVLVNGVTLPETILFGQAYDPEYVTREVEAGYDFRTNDPEREWDFVE